MVKSCIFAAVKLNCFWIKLFYYNVSIKIYKMEFLYILTIIFVVFGLSFLMINIRQVVTGQEFRGTCSTNNPMLKAKIGDCTVCGKTGDEDCKMPEVDKS
ncbi:MAG: hypothetical protein ACI8P3_000301 [Saprospiraceae bacterium]